MLQAAMGWMNGHLHMFVVGDEHYSEPSPYDPGHLAELNAQDSTHVKLSDLLHKPGDVLRYDYDFGDGWEHEVSLEAILPIQPDAKLPIIIAGQRACPPEDVGGVYGYHDFCAAMADPKHPEHEDYMEWFGKAYDPEAFDLDLHNVLLAGGNISQNMGIDTLFNLFGQPNLPFTEAHQATINGLTITPEHPGRILRDFTTMLEVLREKPHPLTPTQQLPLKLVEQINQRLSQPYQHGLQRASMKSFPHIQGMYLLLRASGLTYVDETSSKPKLVVDEAVYMQWMQCNPTEQYGHLLESWFLRGTLDILGEIPYGFGRFPRHLEQIAHLLAKIPAEGLSIAENKRQAESLRYFPGGYNLALMDLFGLADIQFITSPPGQAWAIDTIQRTTVGDAILALLNKIVNPELMFTLEIIMLPSESFGKLQSSLQPYLPVWQTVLTPPRPATRQGTHVFKVSLGSIWRRIAIGGSQSLDSLAGAILDAVKFDHDHLYHFAYRNRLGSWETINHPALEEPPFTSIVTVGEVPIHVGQRMTYLFDFGDHWEFDVLFESLEPKGDLQHARVSESHGRAPKQYRSW